MVAVNYLNLGPWPGAQGSGAEVPLPRNRPRPRAVPKPPRWSTAPQSRGVLRPRSLPGDWRRILPEALGPRPEAGLRPLRKQRRPEGGPLARGLQQVEGRKLPNNLRPGRGPAPRVTGGKEKSALTHRRKEGPLRSRRKEARATSTSSGREMETEQLFCVVSSPDTMLLSSRPFQWPHSTLKDSSTVCGQDY
ncbi:uncharacterized protein LOC115063619 [Mus pahari]|uniref:uncharacterized protein LOC115063619 n=1 Tax=Mus pahari TaxID=10093 RepID=UPI001114E5E2|nr:uncharacterized protein LOC115063619 [Mus pahari]